MNNLTVKISEEEFEQELKGKKIKY